MHHNHCFLMRGVAQPLTLLEAAGLPVDSGSDGIVHAEADAEDVILEQRPVADQHVLCDPKLDAGDVLRVLQLAHQLQHASACLESAVRLHGFSSRKKSKTRGKRKAWRRFYTLKERCCVEVAALSAG
jgi:hypothetical protein